MTFPRFRQAQSAALVVEEHCTSGQPSGAASIVQRMAAVSHAHKAQPLRGQHHRPLKVAAFLAKQHSDFFDRTMTPSNFEQTAGDSPHHAAEKGCPDHVEPNFISDLPNLHPIKTTNRILDRRIELFGEGAKIMRAHELRCCELHLGHIQRAAILVSETTRERIARLGADTVAVPAVLG